MEYTPISPFKRPITRAHLRVVDAKATPTHCPDPGVSKWQVLRDLAKARATYNLSERELGVLQALLSFFPDDMLGGSSTMIVFPSNRTICERLHGMACSTMRRHLARLVASGLLIRRDSPNGKRYVRTHGDTRSVYGFDLSPLHQRAREIAIAAEEVRATEHRISRLRDTIRLMRRDIVALAQFGASMDAPCPLWDQMLATADVVATALRRKLPLQDLLHLRARLEAVLDTARDQIDGPGTEEMITCDAQNEHHLLNSNKDSHESEPQKTESAVASNPPDISADSLDRTTQTPRIPLTLVTGSCPSLATFYPGAIRHWHQLHAAACHIRPSMGIDARTWDEAQRCMGPETASIALAAILERFSEIRSPGAYLRALSTKAAAGEFSCGPMIMALVGRRAA